MGVSKLSAKVFFFFKVNYSFKSCPIIIFLTKNNSKIINLKDVKVIR